MKVVRGALAAAAMLAGAPAWAAAPTAEEMWAVIQAQQAEIARLRALVEESRAEAAAAVAEAGVARAEGKAVAEQMEATAVAVEEMAAGGSGSGGGWWERTSVGGYGELHANYFSDGEDQVDFHRFVLFVGHQYNDWISLFTEFELEHGVAGEGYGGEVELEQAFIQLKWTERFSTDAGLFLMPVGMTNETHEPDTFYGVERNNIETRIIPTTWWEAGLKGTWRFASGLTVDAGVTSGLDMPASGVIRSGRQKVSEALNEAPGYVARVKYTGVPGLELGASVYYQDDVAQSVAADIQGLLTSAHVDYRRGGLRLRALYARWDLDGTTDPAAETQDGYFLEPSYRWKASERFGDVGVYFRFSDYKYFSGRLLKNQISEIGINYWPVEEVVFKVDVQDISQSDQYGAKGDHVLNLGAGFHF